MFLCWLHIILTIKFLSPCPLPYRVSSGNNTCGVNSFLLQHHYYGFAFPAFWFVVFVLFVLMSSYFRMSSLLSDVGCALGSRRALGRVVCVVGRFECRLCSLGVSWSASRNFWKVLSTQLRLRRRAVAVRTFLWSAGGTFNVVFAIGTTLPTSTFRHFCGRPRLMSSLLGLPNSIQQFKCHTTLYICYPFFRRACL